MCEEPIGWDGIERREAEQAPDVVVDVWTRARTWARDLRDAELLLWLLATSTTSLHGYMDWEHHKFFAVALEQAYERGLLGPGRRKIAHVEQVVRQHLDGRW